MVESARHRLLFRFTPKNAPKLHFEEIVADQNRLPKYLDDTDLTGYFMVSAEGLEPSTP